MKKFLFTLSIAGLLAPTAAFAYGEGESIPYIGRAMHLLTNEVRTDVYAAIDACGEYCHEGKHCYKPSYKALYWSDNLFRAAQFHAAMSSSITPPRLWLYATLFAVSTRRQFRKTVPRTLRWHAQMRM